MCFSTVQGSVIPVLAFAVFTVSAGEDEGTCDERHDDNATDEAPGPRWNAGRGIIAGVADGSVAIIGVAAVRDTGVNDAVHRGSGVHVAQSVHWHSGEEVLLTGADAGHVDADRGCRSTHGCVRTWRRHFTNGEVLG